MKMEYIRKYGRTSKEAFQCLHAFYDALNVYLERHDTQHAIQEWTEWFSDLDDLYDMMSFTYAVSGASCQEGDVTILVDICKDNGIWILYCQISLYYLECYEIKRLKTFICSRYNEAYTVTYGPGKYLRYVTCPVSDEQRVKVIGDALLYGAKMVKKIVRKNKDNM